MAKLDESIEANIGDYRNATNVSSTQLPDLDAMRLQEQLIFCFDISGDEINDSHIETYSNKYMPHMDDSPFQDV